MSKDRQTKFNLPGPKCTEVKTEIFPHNGAKAVQNSLTFSFACFDREHALFNLGGDAEDKTVGGAWFIDLLDCLKSVSNKKIPEIKTSLHDLHPINWSKTNTSAPDGDIQHEYWQFRISKSKGRVIGFIVWGKEHSVFYVVWLDPHHNLIDSEGYGGIDWYSRPMSEYEKDQAKIDELSSLLAEADKKYKELEDDYADVYSQLQF